MLRKTKEQNNLNLFSLPDQPDKVAEFKETKKLSDTISEGTLRITSKQNVSDSFFGLGQLAESVETAKKVSKAIENERRSSKEHLAGLSEEQKSRKLSGFDPMTSNGSSIISANAAGITDNGGSNKQTKMPISNSIFDPSRNQREASKIGEKTENQIVQETIATNKRTAEKERMDTLAEILSSPQNGSSVHRTGTGNSESTEFKASKNNMSIFDSNNFSRIPEKTEGEMLSEKVAKKRAEIDSSWRNNGKSLKSSEVQSNFFDNLLENLDSNERE